MVQFEIHRPDKILHFGDNYVGYCEAGAKASKGDTADKEITPDTDSTRGLSQARARILKEATRD